MKSLKETLKEVKRSGIKIGWGLTHLCNMRCIFCYSWKVRQSPGVWSLENTKEFIDLNKRIIDDINWGTGENVLLDWFPEVVEYIHSLGIPQSITTNGSISILRKSKKEKIYENIEEIDVSIDFPDGDSHNRLRGYTNAFKIALKTIEEARDHDIKTTIVSVLGSFNANPQYFKGLLDLAERENSYFRVNLLVPTRKEIMKFMASLSQIFSVFEMLFSKSRVISVSDNLIFSLFSLRERYPKLARFLNYVGRSYRILPDGAITPNTYLISDEWKISNVIGKTINIEDLVLSKQTKNFYNAALRELESRVGGGFERSAMCNGDCYLKYENFSDIYLSKEFFEKLIDLMISKGREIELNIVDDETIHSEYLATSIFAPEGL